MDQMLQKYSSIWRKSKRNLEQITNKDSHLSTLNQQIEEIEKDAYLEAIQLHDIRKRAANSLTKAIYKEFKGLYLEKASFSISFDNEENHLNRWLSILRNIRMDLTRFVL